jgi:hypothetical protein
MGRGSQGQTGQQGSYSNSMSGNSANEQTAGGGMAGRTAGGQGRLPNMQGSPFPGRGPMATMPGADGGISSAPWGDIDWMKLRDQFAQGQQGGGGAGWMEALKNRGNQQGRGAPHPNGMTQAMSQARAFSPSSGGSQEGFRPQGINPITTAGSVAGTQQSPTASIETGVTPQSAVAGAQPAPAGPPPAAPTGVAPAPAQPGGAGGANAQALIQALRARAR